MSVVIKTAYIKSNGTKRHSAFVQVRAVAIDVERNIRFAGAYATADTLDEATNDAIVSLHGNYPETKNASVVACGRVNATMIDHPESWK